MEQGKPLVATKTALLWAAIVSDTAYAALRDPQSRAAQKLLSTGVDEDSLHDVSVIVRAACSNGLEEVHVLFKMFCTPEPCRVGREALAGALKKTEQILAGLES